MDKCAYNIGKLKDSRRDFSRQVDGALKKSLGVVVLGPCLTKSSSKLATDATGQPDGLGHDGYTHGRGWRTGWCPQRDPQGKPAAELCRLKSNEYFKEAPYSSLCGQNLQH